MMRIAKFCLFFICCSQLLFAGGTLKIATYNIYFLDDGISAARKANLQEVMQKLNADIIAFQEINNEAALKTILPDDYALAMIDDPDEVQEVALATRAPFKITETKFIFPSPDLDHPFPRSRNLLQVSVSAFGQKFIFLVHHAKSRSGGRNETAPRREKAAEMIVEYIKSNLQNQSVILLGDFNDNPDDKSVNIYEYGDAATAGGIDVGEDTFLYNAAEDLLNWDICTYGHSYLKHDTSVDTFNTTVLGAARENNKWRNNPHDFYNDVRVKAILFDQILLSKNLKSRVKKRGVFNGIAAVRGEASRIRFTDNGLVYTKRGDLASDHVPMWVVLEVE